MLKSRQLARLRRELRSKNLPRSKLNKRLRRELRRNNLLSK